MSRIHGRDTKPEMRVRKLLHGMGFRYRLHVKDLPGKPDLVFSAIEGGAFRAWLFLAHASLQIRKTGASYE